MARGMGASKRWCWGGGASHSQRVELLRIVGWRIRGNALAGEKKQGRRMAAWRGRGRGASARGVWGQGGAGEGRWRSRVGAGSWWVGTRGGGDRRRWSRAPVELEVEECRWGLIGKNKKVQGLHYKIKFTTDLGLN